MKKALLIDDECWLRVQARDAGAVARCQRGWAFRFCGANHRRFLPSFLSLEAGVT